MSVFALFFLFESDLPLLKSNDCIATKTAEREREKSGMKKRAVVSNRYFINMKQSREILLKTIYIPFYQDVLFHRLLEFSTSHISCYYTHTRIFHTCNFIFALFAIDFAFHVNASSLATCSIRWDGNENGSKSVEISSCDGITVKMSVFSTDVMLIA